MAPELFIWDHPVSSYAGKVRIALREKKIPFKFETPKGGGSGNKAAMDSSFSQGNMRMEMPLLIVREGDSEFKIWDSTIILEYLEDKFPQVPLLPKSPEARARARMIEDLCDSQYEALNWAMGEVNAYQRAKGEIADRLNEQARYQVKQIYAWLTEQLSDSEWFGGEKFGWADACVWPMVNRSTTYNLGPELGTPLRSWYDRARERESVRLMYDEYQVGVSGPNKAKEALEKGLMKRQYRDHRLEWMVKSGGIDIVAQGIEKGNIRFSWPDPLE